MGLQARAAACQQLVADMDVQGRAMDAARANVEQHYTFIQSRHTDFMRRWVAGSPVSQVWVQKQLSHQHRPCCLPLCGCLRRLASPGTKRRATHSRASCRP